MTTNLARRFLASALRHPSACALAAGDARHSYAELHEAAQLARAGLSHLPPGSHVAVLAPVGLHACAGILGVLAAGHAYIPLNPAYPAARNAAIARAGEARAVVCDQTSAAAARALADELGCPLVLTAPGNASALLRPCDPDSAALRRMAASLPDEPEPVQAHQPAYVMFTSGSTGTPKGIAISHANAGAYFDHVGAALPLTPADRCSQMFELTFDLSVHDMFATWQAGACLCCPSRADRMLPGSFITRHRLTAWFSVPTVGATMARCGQLPPGAFPSLRLSLFCGEALPAAIAAQWAHAAPGSDVVNLYGPTEATIAITQHTWNPETSPARCRNGLVPIGLAFAPQRASIRDEAGLPVADGQVGELWLGGSQIAAGYLHDPQRTGQAFVTDAQGLRWYRTGDLALMDAEGELVFSGRRDSQVKLRGHRVELAEIEHALSRVEGIREAVVLPVTDASGAVSSLVAAIIGDIPPERARQRCQALLPDYMVPARFVPFADFPVNANGKTDRPAIRARIGA
ncbi:amino acid adenylation domain-containing protein [Nitratidesulfovibrio sp.]|uniref:amino acid adenylation domain-containing protein n=1 Tax=Nitratidesulfovibrio sp. TaxID=2802297 RepID=UPI00334083C1